MRDWDNSPRVKRTKARIIEAIRKSDGLLTHAAKLAGVGTTTIYEYVNCCPDVRQAVEEASERVTDMAESALFKNIKDRDDTAILFYLRTKGRNRGYIEKKEVELSGSIRSEAELTDEQLQKVIASGSGPRIIEAPKG